MKVVCDTCGRTAHGTRDELSDLGWSRAVVCDPFRRTFTACWHHGGNIRVNVLAAFDEARAKRPRTVVL